MTNLRTSDTICALATPRGSGAVGIVRLSGPLSGPLLRQLSGRASPRPRRLVPRTLFDPRDHETLDRALVCWMPGPRSYTGEDVVELQAHGGTLNLERLLSVLLDLGARPAEPGEFTRRAFVNGRMDLTQAEAVCEVISARSERALRNAQVVLGGELGQRVDNLRHRVVRRAAELEARVDFADDLEEELLPTDRWAAAHRDLAGDLARLAGTYQQGRILDGVTVAIVGEVNSGKSSIFNKLIGSTRALVSEEPGTTRDYLEAEVVWRGQRVALVDTAGSRDATQMTALERAGHELAAEVVDRAGLKLWLVDLTRPLPPTLGQPAELPTVVVANKVDLAGEAAAAEVRDRATGAVVVTSARTGEGLEALKEAVVDAVTPRAHDSETVLVTRRRQWHALRRAVEALVQAARALDAGLPPEVVVVHTNEALSALDEVSGKRHGEAVLDQVFAGFCIGK